MRLSVSEGNFCIEQESGAQNIQSRQVFEKEGVETLKYGVFEKLFC